MDELNSALGIEAAALNRGETDYATYDENVAKIYEDTEAGRCLFPNDPSGCPNHPR